MSLTPLRRTPRVIATGFTTAFLGDERTLREFIAGEHIRRAVIGSGENALLYLIADSYDPLDVRQLRIGVNKDAAMIRKFEPFCGQPLAEVPDPFDCHPSYSDHFGEALLARLHALDIHPVLIDSYRAYRKGHYVEFVATAFERYAEISELLAREFAHLSMSSLFRAQCPKCLRVDTTDVRGVEHSDVRFVCKRCEVAWAQHISEVRGKLTWKLDCAARWNLHGIDMETFSKAHLARLGTFPVAKVISERFFGGRVPTPIRYGAVKISRDLSYHLIEILPPRLLKRLFTADLARDLTVTREFVETFANKTEVRPGVTYVEYVRRHLPVEILPHGVDAPAHGGVPQPESHPLSERELVAYGNRYSEYYYGRDHRIRMPSARAFAAFDATTAETALRLIRYALSLRVSADTKGRQVQSLLQRHIRGQEPCPKVYQLLRRALGCNQGPHITTLLAVMPVEYLETVELILSCLARGIALAAPRIVASAAGATGGVAEPETEVGVKS